MHPISATEPNHCKLICHFYVQALKEHRPELLERVAAEEAAKKKRAEVSSPSVFWL